jgi:Ca-activated chloride channel family protein
MSLKFLHPAAFWLLLLIPVLLGLKLWGDARARRSVGRLASPRLMPSLLSGRTGRIGWVMFGLEVLAFILFAAALARPQYGVIMEESEGKGRNVIVAIDTSKSMLANDLAPSRLERAMLAAEDLVNNLRGDRVGLMPFAGSAYMYAPLTLDTEGVLDCIHSLDTDIIPLGGMALRRLKKPRSPASGR